MDDKATDAAELASQTIAAVAVAEPAKPEAGHQGTGGSPEAAVAIDASPQSAGEEGAEAMDKTSKPRADAGHNSVLRIVVDEARHLPEATSGAHPSHD